MSQLRVDVVTDEEGTGSPSFPNGIAELPTVLKPEPVSPANNATEISETPTLDGGTYYSLYGKTHAISRFQVATDAAFTSIVYDSGEIGATETHDVPSGNLVESTDYYWRVYYEDEDGVKSEFSDAFEFTTSDSFFIELDLEDPNNIGQRTNGGFLVGIIDTVAGTIDSQDDYQTGERYALIISPKNLEKAEAGIRWDSVPDRNEPGSITRWDGLSSTENILSKNDPDYEVFEYIRSIRSSDPVPSDGGSDWYVPAMDELEIMFRNLKPNSNDNSVGTSTAVFPGTQDYGFNPSSDPTSSAYTATGEPFQTTATDFQQGGSQQLDYVYWSSTDSSDSGQAWTVYVNFAGTGPQYPFSKEIAGSTQAFVRPVRRVPL